MATATSQAIAGVSPQTEATIISVYPSIASKGMGRSIGQVCDSIPTKILGVKISCILFALPLAPLSLIGYALTKMAGLQFEVTNRSLKVWQMSLGAKSRLINEVSIDDIADVAIEVRPGQEFYHAADMYLLKEDGTSLLRMEGIPRPEVFRQNILKTCDAKSLTAEALKVIEARS
jgi:hypothetical protein